MQGLRCGPISAASRRARHRAGTTALLFLLAAAACLGVTFHYPKQALAVGLLTCGGNTIYNVDTGGNLYSLNATTGANTRITTFSTTATIRPNGLAVTPNGTAAYVVVQSGQLAATATILRYDATTGTISSFQGTALPTLAQNSIMGAVDPSTGIFYYGTIDNTELVIFGFNTNTNTAIPGVVATVNIAGSTLVNGDFAFDQLGNLYILEGDSTGRNASAIVRVNGPLPTTGTATPPPPLPYAILARPPATGSTSNVYNGIAFGPGGLLYAQYAASATNATLVAINPNSGATVTTHSQSGLSAQPDDLAGCSYTGTLQVQKNIVARVAPTDQFDLSVTGSGIAGGNTGATSGAANGVQTSTGEIAGPVLGVPGNTYTVSEGFDNGANPAAYVSSWSCVDPSTGTSYGSGNGTTGTVVFPQPANGGNGANITCTFTNAPAAPTIQLSKALLGPRADDTDQFQVALHTGSPTGPIVAGGPGDPSATTQGTGATVTSGTGTTPVLTATAGTTYFATETPAGTTVASNYRSTITCNDAAGALTNLPSGAAFTGSAAITPAPGSIISCVVSNTTAPATLTVQKTLVGPRVHDTDQVDVQIHTGGIAGPIVGDQTNATTQGTGASITPGTGVTSVTATNLTTAYTIDEVGTTSVNAALYTATITCTDASGQATGLPQNQPFDFNVGVTITPSRPGEQIGCTLTNTAVDPSITLIKALNGERAEPNDQATMEIHQGSPTGPTVGDTTNATTQGTDTQITPGTGVTSVTATEGRPYFLFDVGANGTKQENYSPTIQCTDANGAQPDLPGPGTPLAGYLEIVPVAGADITCTLTNTPIPAPTIEFDKVLNGNRVQPGDQFGIAIRTGGAGGPIVSSILDAITTGTGSTIDPPTGTTGVFQATVGTQYFLTETPFGTTNLATYAGFITCTDESGLQTGLPDNQPFNGSFPLTVTQTGSRLFCTLTNEAAPPTITLTKALDDQRAFPGDQFTVQIQDASGAVVGNAGNATTTGTGSTVTAGTGTTAFTGVAGDTYTLDEVGADGADLADYTQLITCTDANGRQPGLPTNAPFDPATGLSITPVPGAAIGCTLTNHSLPQPTLTFAKVLNGDRAQSSDQFTVQIRTGGATGTVVSDPTNATTQGTGSSVTSGTGTTGTFTAAPGTHYVLTEAGAGGALLSDYNQLITCSDANGVQTGLPVGRPFDPATGLSITPALGAAISCVLTNSTLPPPTLDLSKALASNRARSGDQFTVQIHTGSATGPVVNDTTNATTAGAGSVVTAGTGTTGVFAATEGTEYFLTEAAANGANLSAYSTTITCVDPTGLQANLPTDLPVTLPFTLTPARGSEVSCVLTNQTLAPTLDVTKALQGARANPGDQFTVQLRTGSATGPVVSDTTNATTSGTGAAVDPGTGTTGAFPATAGTTYFVTEAAAGGASLADYNQSITCLDGNGVQTGLPQNEAFQGSFPVTPVPGASIQCTLTNSTVPLPTVTVLKALGTNRARPMDQFIPELRFQSPTGPIVTDQSHAQTTGTGSSVTLGSGTTNAFSATLNTPYFVTETAAGTTALGAYSAIVNCTDPTGLQTGLPVGVPLGGGVQVLPTARGAQITCVIINSAISPTLQLTKALAGARAQPGDQFTMQIHADTPTGPVVSDATNATTTGSGSTVDPNTGTTGAFPAVVGTTYFLTESSSGGALLSDYAQTITCSDANSVMTGLPVAAPFTGSLAITPVPGAAVSCILTNSSLPPPTLQVTKAFGTSRVQPDDQFTVAIRSGGATGPTVSDPTNATTQGAGSAVTPGTGTTGIFTATEGTTYFLTESGAGATDASLYSATISCVDPTGKQTALPTNAAFSGSFSILPVRGAEVSCVISNSGIGPTLSLNKALGTARAAPADQFTVAIHSGSATGPVVNDPAGATTTGSGATVDTGTGTTGTFQATAGTTYVLTEAAAGGAELGNYTESITCSDANGVQAGLPVGAPFSGSLSITPQLGAAISCTLTNDAIPLPTISVSKALATSRVRAGDQFAVEIRTGGDAGTVVSDQTDATTQGAGSAVTAGTGTTGLFTAAVGTTYSLTETGAGTTDLSLYTDTITCTDPTGLQTGLPVDQPLNGGVQITPGVRGAQIACVITNSALGPTLQFSKALAGTRAHPADQFTVQIRTGSATGPVVSDGNDATTAGSGSSITSGSGTTGAFAATAGTTYFLTEAGAGGALLTNYNQTITCSDANSVMTGLPVGAPFTGSLAITPVLGAAISCIVTNSTIPPPTLQVTKAFATNREQPGDQFSVAIRTGGATGAIVSDQTNDTTLGSGSAVTPGTGTTGIFAATEGTTYFLTEGATGSANGSLYTATITCVDPTGRQTGLPTDAPFSGSTSIVPVRGAEISCVISNSGTQPTLSLNKTLGTTRAQTGDQFTVAIHQGTAGGPVVDDPAGATTAGSGSTVSTGTGTAGVVQATAGTTYSLTEVAAGGADLADYTDTITCTDANGIESGLPTNAPFPGSFSLTPVLGAAISCTLTNSAIPAATISLGKALSTSRVQPGDQFSVVIRTGGATGPVVSDQTNDTTQGSGSAVTPGTGTTGTFTAADGTTYFLTESGAGTTNASLYSATITCVDATGRQTGLPTGAPFSGSVSILPVRGAQISCVITNGGNQPTLSLDKVLSATRAQAGDQFTVAIHSGSATGPVVDNPANATTAGTGATVSAGTGTTGLFGVTAGTTYWLTEAGDDGANLRDYTETVTCVDANGVQQGLPTQAPFPGALTITPQLGAAISCTLSNDPIPPPTISVSKALATTRVQTGDQFAVQIRTGGDTGPVVSDQTSATTGGAGSVVTAGTGTTGTFQATAGTTYFITETAAGTTSLRDYTGTITCTDEAGLQTGLPSDQPFAGSLTLTVADRGSRIDCVVTNSGDPPTLDLTKALGSTRVDPGDQFTVQIHSGSATGPVVDDPTHATTAGSGPAVSAGSGNTGAFVATPGTTYWLTEAADDGALLSDYTTTITCTDANGVQTGLPHDATFAGAFQITPVLGSAITCTLTNRAAPVPPASPPPASPPAAGPPPPNQSLPPFVPGLPNTGVSTIARTGFGPLLLIPVGVLLVLLGLGIARLRRRRRRHT